MKESLKEVVLSLHWACITGNVGLVKFALDQGVPVDCTVNGFVPLQLSCISDNNIAVTQYLIDRGADVNIQKWSKKKHKTHAIHNATGSTALHVACANGCIKTVDLLIRNHALIDIKDKYGSTPLDIAQAKNEVEIVKRLTKKDTRKSVALPILAHRRTTSDKSVRARRPSMPSIFEKQGHSENFNFISSSSSPLPAPAFISMTPEPISRRSLTSAHRPWSEELQPIPIKHASDQPIRHHKRGRSAYSTEEFSLGPTSDSSSSLYRSILSDGSSSVVTLDHHPDWYSYGIVHPYAEDSYLQSLERRAFHSDPDESSVETEEDVLTPTDHLCASAEESKRESLENACSLSDDPISSKSKKSIRELAPYQLKKALPLDPMTTAETKKGWFSSFHPYSHDHQLSLDIQSDLDSLPHSKRKNQSRHASDEKEKPVYQTQQRSGFLSRWTPSWSKKQTS
ncbi:hypothetical protein EDC96DRAFT_514815 [Choanephora cucurbitarum]|nr:hypothetical protein EDC96DRAFT_514815 [Choanephora cucurbitarum]